MRVHLIYNPNTRKMHTEVRVHKAGCRDIGRDLRNATSDYEIDTASQHEAAEDFYSDFIAEGSMTAADAMHFTEFLPCTEGLPQ